MFRVEIYGRVRRAVLVEGRSQRAVAREFGLARVTVQKMLRYAVPPGYQRQQAVKRPKLGPWVGVIDAILEEDKSTPPKQRHTAKRIFERLREEHDFTGGYTIVKDYVHTAKLRSREMFVPLDARAGRGAGRLRRSVGGDGRGGAARRTSWRGSATLGRLLRHRVSGRDDGGIPGRPRARLCLLRRGSHADSLRQHEDRGGAHSGRTKSE